MTVVKGELLDTGAGVTTINPVQSRNGGCPLCERWPDGSGRRRSYDELTKAGMPEGLVGWNFTHCTACHSPKHNACVGCGGCLVNHKGAHRSDKAFCSSACRQRAYRKRREAGA